MLRPILLGICIALTTFGCATTAPSADKPVAKAALATDYIGCIRSTGTRIPVKDGECTGAVGRSYTKDDLDSTGQTNTAEALRMLDPSLGR